MTTATDNLLTPQDLAEVLGVKVEKVMEWRRQFDWPHVRIGRQFRWTPAQVEQIVARHAVTPTHLAAASGQTARSAARRRSA